MRTTLTKTLIILMIISTITTTGLSVGQEQPGVSTDVSVEVDRADSSITDRLHLYCRTHNIERCEDDFSLLDIPHLLYFANTDAETRQQMQSDPDETEPKHITNNQNLIDRILFWR